MLDRKKIGDILVELQVLSAAEVDAVLTALRRRGDQAKFGQVARDMGLVREEHILAALSVQLELLPNVQAMSLRRLLDRLRAPIPPLERSKKQPERRQPPKAPSKTR